MTQIKISDLLVSFLLFTIGALLVITLMITISSDAGDLVGDDGDFRNLSSSFNRSADIISTVNNLQADLSQAQEGDFLGSFGVLGGLINVVWQSIKALPNLILETGGFMIDILSAFAFYLKLPTWIVGLVGAILTVIVIFAIFSAVFQREI